MKLSFKQKLILSYAFVILASFGLIAFFLDKRLEENSLQGIRSSLINQAVLVESQIPPAFIRKDSSQDIDKLAKALSPRIDCRITVINSMGLVLGDSEKPFSEIPAMENHLNRPEVRAALAGRTGTDTRYSSTLKSDMLYVAVPANYNDEIVGTVRLALPLTSVKKTLATVRKTVALGLLFALALAFILGSALAARTINPINRMIQISRRFSEGDLSRRMIQLPSDEIGELGATLNRMAQDIEDKIREVRAQNQKLGAIFNSMIEGVLVVDKAGRIVSVNPAVEKIFGISKKDAEGRAFLEAIRNNDMADVIKRTLEEGRAVAGEIALVYPVRKIFQVSATPFFDNKAISGCLAVIHDITEMRRLETVRSDFVANVSHELKTPLTSIKGFVETLLEGAIEDEENGRSFLKIVQEHTERLNSLVDDLLSLSHLESKEIAIDKKEFNLRQQVEGIIMGFGSQMKKKGIEIRNELPPDISVKADKDRIDQVITNLIDNAIKFNRDKGLIKIYGSEEGDKMKIIVEDSGIGIPEKDVPRIFERFYRVDKARSRSLGGTGLGLSIVKHIVELHGGTVGVESAEGLGSKFWFTLPK